MSRMLFKRAAATGAAFVALGFAGAVPSVASASTGHPVASHGVHVAQAHQYPRGWCGHWPYVYWCDYGYHGHHGGDFGHHGGDFGHHGGDFGHHGGGHWH